MNNMSNLLENLLQSKGVLLADGATGSNLFQMGLQTGEAAELCNSDYPERIAAHYRSFVDAGSDVILSNTFGGSRYRLQQHQAADCVAQLNIAAVELLKQEIEQSEREIVYDGTVETMAEYARMAMDAGATQHWGYCTIAGQAVGCRWLSVANTRTTMFTQALVVLPDRHYRTCSGSC
jgi:S-methylmethionine-dependent homocysteine/selenocysteine methylase